MATMRIVTHTQPQASAARYRQSVKTTFNKFNNTSHTTDRDVFLRNTVFASPPSSVPFLGALRQMQPFNAELLVRNGLTSSMPNVRLAALVEVNCLKAPDALSSIQSALTNKNEDQNIRFAAIEKIGYYRELTQNSPESRAAFYTCALDIIKDKNEPETLRAALFDTIIEHLTNRFERRALSAHMRITDKSTDALILEAMKSTSPKMQAAGYKNAFRLSDARKGEASKLVEETLKDETKDVKLRAAAANSIFLVEPFKLRDEISTNIMENVANEPEVAMGLFAAIMNLEEGVLSREETNNLQVELMFLENDKSLDAKVIRASHDAMWRLRQQ